MSRLLESIRCENGALQNLPFHQARMDASVMALFAIENRLCLEDVEVPADCKAGLYKCRVTYGESLQSVEFQPYRRREIRSLRLVTDDTIDYAHKYADRTALQRLLETRGDCDDILIVKEGRITDTSYSNVALFDGKQWCTPARPLLCGTQREKLIAEGVVSPADVRADELERFQKIRIINAMIRFEDRCDIPLERLVR